MKSFLYAFHGVVSRDLGQKAAQRIVHNAPNKEKCTLCAVLVECCFGFF